ncbi:MAG: AAA family ATPase [Streptosporangiales bacterium]|nr:AAA family ATPase [Streptosporangiales bacterium]
MKARQLCLLTTFSHGSLLNRSGSAIWRGASQVDLDAAEFDEALAMVKAQHGILVDRPAPAPEPIKREDLAAGAGEGVARLLTLGGLQEVGLVHEREELSFAPTGMTVIYGQNGTGKSSYVRAVKKLCRTVDRDCRVRSSIYDASSGGVPPTARIKVDLDGEITEQRTTLNASPAVRLPGISVFDSVCAELYVDAENAVRYIPTELRLLTRLAVLQDRMRHALAEERNTLENARPFLERYPSTTQVGRALAQLTGNSADPDLAELATLTDAEMERLTELRAHVATATTSTARDDAAAVRREVAEAEALADMLTDLRARVDEEAAARLRTAASEVTAAREAVRLAAQGLHGPILGVGTDPWRLLWGAARTFIEGQGGQFPPGAGQPCPLCLQAVTDDAATRMAHFDAHVSGAVQAAANAADETLAEALEASAPRRADAVRTPLLLALREREPALAAQVDEAIDDIMRHMTAMTASPDEATAAHIDVTPAVTALMAWASGRSSHAEALSVSENPEELARLRAELAEFEARDSLGADLSVFNTWRERLCLIAALDRTHTALATNRITTAQRELAENQVGKALDAALAEELAKLSCTLPVRLITRTARAETSVAVRLLTHDPAPVSEIASEGEQRSLALAFFFAELAIAKDNGSIILDDPVSSLDDERRGYIADRLVAEAEHRQVIVFTHDLPFLFDLEAQAKAHRVSLAVHGMWREGDIVGRIDEDPPFKAMKLKARIGKLKERVAQWDAEPRPANQDEAWHRVTAFYSDLRTTWERAVEERLFQGVVQRFQRSVKTQSLKDVKVTPELIEQINTGMSRTSTFVHDEPVGGAVPLPGRTQLAADLEMLVKFAEQAPPKS